MRLARALCACFSQPVYSHVCITQRPGDFLTDQSPIVIFIPGSQASPPCHTRVPQPLHHVAVPSPVNHLLQAASSLITPAPQSSHRSPALDFQRICNGFPLSPSSFPAHAKQQNTNHFSRQTSPKPVDLRKFVGPLPRPASTLIFFLRMQRDKCRTPIEINGHFRDSPNHSGASPAVTAYSCQ